MNNNDKRHRNVDCQNRKHRDSESRLQMIYSPIQLKPPVIQKSKTIKYFRLPFYFTSCKWSAFGICDSKWTHAVIGTFVLIFITYNLLGESLARTNDLVYYFFNVVGLYFLVWSRKNKQNLKDIKYGFFSVFYVAWHTLVYSLSTLIFINM